MSDPAAPPPADGFSADTFASQGPDVIAPGEGELIVNLEGFEGPLDLLLALARDQKVDLRRISMVALVDQYLSYITQARRIRLELAADYLVMAAWLAYLKSRLLLPEPPPGEEPSGQEMADALQWQLRRLEASVPGADLDEALDERLVVTSWNRPHPERGARGRRVLQFTQRGFVAEVDQQVHGVPRQDQDARGSSVIRQVADVDQVGDDQRIEAEAVEGFSDADQTSRQRRGFGE